MSSASVTPNRSQNDRLSHVLIVAGLISCVAAAAIFIGTFYPVLREEIRYLFQQSRGQEGSATKKTEEIVPVNTDFSIVIPKIGANAPIVANVDPNNPYVYQRKLTKGVAHARGTSLPGRGGNTFLFAHSAGNFYDAGKYNAVFYLLRKLEKDDEIDVYYKGERIRYVVTSTQIVEPSAVSYIYPSKVDSLTLMTCWPPGTTLKRLIVKGKVQHKSPKVDKE